MNIGTCSNLELLLHCYYSPEPHPRIHAPAIAEGLALLLNHEMIQRDHGSDPKETYELTAKGRCYLNHILEIPFPVQRWEIPPMAAE